jgi:hypothetical protein
MLDPTEDGPWSFKTQAVEARILTVVRNPATNQTHPNTLSVPTQRIPDALLADLTSRPSLDAANPVLVSNVDTSGHDAVIYAVESLLASKLGLADALESGAFEFEGAVGVTSTGDVHYPNEGVRGVRTERITMVNLIVLVRRGIDVLPESTAAYTSLNWAPWQRLGQAASENDVTRLVPGLDPVEICIHGLCIATSVQLWERLLTPASS